MKKVFKNKIYYYSIYKKMENFNLSYCKNLSVPDSKVY